MNFTVISNSTPIWELLLKKNTEWVENMEALTIQTSTKTVYYFCRYMQLLPVNCNDNKHQFVTDHLIISVRIIVVIQGRLRNTHLRNILIDK